MLDLYTPVYYKGEKGHGEQVTVCDIADAGLVGIVWPDGHRSMEKLSDLTNTKPGREPTPEEFLVFVKAVASKSYTKEWDIADNFLYTPTYQAEQLLKAAKEWVNRYGE